MAVNSVFKTNNLAALKSEQNLYSDLIKEAIQIYGHDVYYIDRTLVARDNVLGEDSLSKYTNTNPIEMYVEDATGYAGEKEIITQFGLENRNEITFVVNKKRFQEMDSQISLEDGTDTTGGSIQLEAGTIDQTSTSSRLETDDPLIAESNPAATFPWSEGVIGILTSAFVPVIVIADSNW